MYLIFDIFLGHTHTLLNKFSFNAEKNNGTAKKS